MDGFTKRTNHGVTHTAKWPSFPPHMVPHVSPPPLLDQLHLLTSVKCSRPYIAPLAVSSDALTCFWFLGKLAVVDHMPPPPKKKVN